MLNSKLEKILFILVLYTLLIVLKFIFQISSPPNNINKFVIVFLGVTITLCVYRIYTYYRNKHILKNVNILLEASKFEEAIKYIDKCLEKKNCPSIYMYRLYVIAFCGRISEFEDMLGTCEKSKRYKKIITLDFTKALKGIINFLKTGNCEVEHLKQQHWLQIITVLSEKNCEKNISALLNMYNTKFNMLKTVLAFKLHLTYLKLNDVKNSEYYYNEALEHAPSPEIIYCIKAYNK